MPGPILGFEAQPGQPGIGMPVLDRGGAAHNAHLWASLADAITALGTEDPARLILPPGLTRTLTDDLTIPANITLVAQMGVIETDGHTLTIEGGVEGVPVHLFDTSGGGAVVFAEGARVEQVFAEMWGAVRYDDDSAIRDLNTHAINAALATGFVTTLLEGDYFVSDDPLVMRTNGQVFQGGGMRQTRIRFPSLEGECLHLGVHAVPEVSSHIPANSVHVRDMALYGAGGSAITNTSAGISFRRSTRSQISNVFVTRFGYGIETTRGTDLNAAAWVNNIDHCYLLSNERCGIYLPGNAHAFSVSNQTEIAGSPFGVVHGRFRDDIFDIDHDITSVIGQGVTVTDCTIEGIHAVDNGSYMVGGVGVYSQIGNKGVAVTGTYFEEMDIAYQAGSHFRNDGTTPNSSVLENPVFTNNYVAAVGVTIKVGRVRWGNVSDNYITGGVLFDVSEAHLFDRVQHSGNRQGGFAQMFNGSITGAQLLGELGENQTGNLRGWDGSSWVNMIQITPSVWQLHASRRMEVRDHIRVGPSGAGRVYGGSGSPEGVQSAPVGSTFLRSDGGASTVLYVKESGTGNTGWVAK